MLGDSGHLNGGDVEFRIGVHRDIASERIDDHIDRATRTELSDPIICLVVPAEARKEAAAGRLGHSFGVIGAGTPGHQAGQNQDHQ